MNIFLDVDDVVLKWQEAYASRYKCEIPKRWRSSKMMTERLSELRKDKEFWVNLEPKHRPNFIPAGFVSARSIPVQWTKDAMKKHNIPGRSTIIHVDWGESKIDILKELKCDIFIDDRYKTFRECQKNGVFCLLMDASHNQHVKTKYRIYDLDIENILSLWRKLR